ncbi:FimV/HubP family polar landmark protein [Oceanimonas baumannii]|uniref:FimV/HubP family polar landmark protein n=3 Tax=Oceanimonas baumannii TaxID=129578 RepID=UPI001FD11FDA|nr:FimV/HubP family polar landmark protein [Oceanimonas baumannii]
MKRRRPPLYSVLALWLCCTLPVTAQEFYIELRGPETPVAQTAAETPAAPVTVQARRHGPIRSTDTLWSIAAQHTRAPATVQQTMVALYYLNPGAFVRGNINYLQRGAMLTLPTLSQAQQRSPREAETEFRRLSRQGNRAVTRAPVSESNTRAAAAPKEAKPAPSPAPATAPAVASPPVVAKNAPQPADNGLSEPRAASPRAPQQTTAEQAPSETVLRQASAPVTEDMPAGNPERSEQVALERLQAQLLDELREQVAMSNEQLAELADNNQVLRRRLGQLTAEVNELKLTRVDEAAAPAVATGESAGWLSQILKQPVNLAMLLTLPALLLLALFTLWWRKHTKEDLAEQEKTSSELMMDEDNNDFDDLFAVDFNTDEQQKEKDAELQSEPEAEIDEDAFARFLEEQQQLEEQEAAMGQVAEPAEEALSDEIRPEDEPEALFDDAASGEQADALFDDAASREQADALFDDAARREQADALFDDAASGEQADALFDDAARREQADALFDDAASREQADALFDDAARREQADVLFDDAAGRDQTETLMDDQTVQDEMLSDDKPLSSELANDVADFSRAGDNITSDDINAAFDNELFNLDETAAVPASERPAPDSLAGQGAFSDSVAGDFDDILAETLSDREADALLSMQATDNGTTLTPQRDPMLRQELDDYADLLGNAQGVDIDVDEGGMGAKLDLARAYIEIDDFDSARELLNEALERGNEQHQSDARKLLQRLDKR